eukprot:364281-Chlamydomonas_euryale.AAC.2
MHGLEYDRASGRSGTFDVFQTFILPCSTIPVASASKDAGAEAEAVRGAEEAMRKGLNAAAAAAAGGGSELERELIDTIRRMAVVQSKHAKLAREYEASVQSEQGLTNQVEELQEVCTGEPAVTCFSRGEDDKGPGNRRSIGRGWRLVIHVEVLYAAGATFAP